MKSSISVCRTLIALIAFLSVRVPAALADPIQAMYSTTGTVGTAGIDGPPVVSFSGISSGTLTAGQPFNLGDFVILVMPVNGPTTYNNTPFELTFTEHTVNGAIPSPNQTPVTLNGWLNGTVNSGSSPNLVANFVITQFPATTSSPVPLTTIEPFQTGSLLNGLYVTSWSENGQPIIGELSTERIVPEPGMIALYAVTGSLLVCRWRIKAHSQKRCRNALVRSD